MLLSTKTSTVKFLFLFAVILAGFNSICEAFSLSHKTGHAPVPLGGHRSSSSSICSSRIRDTGCRLFASILLDFENVGDDNDDDDESNDTKRNAREVTNQGNQQEIFLIFESKDPFGTNSVKKSSSMPSNKSSSLISKWKEQLENNRSPPMTSTKRVRLEREISLLQQLAHGNEAATELSNLWINERGPGAAQALRIAKTLGQTGAWQQAEQVLILMIEEEGIHFLAPLSQLAQLYAQQGRLHEAKELHQLVLSQKPWYLNSLLGVHEVCKKMDTDQKELVKWDRQVIPYMENRAMRVAWVERMVAKAQQMLQNSEKELKGYFDEFYNAHGSEGTVLVEDDNSGQ